MSQYARLIFISGVVAFGSLLTFLRISPAEAAGPGVFWCGGEASSTDRPPDAISGRQLHVLYAAPADGVDRFAEIAPLIAADLSAVDRWWQRQDPTRAPRFDLVSAAGCGPASEELDLSAIRLPRSSTSYTSDDYANFTADLRSAGFDSRFKKYVVYYDGDPQTNVCGIASNAFPREGGAASTLVVWLQSLCPRDLGSGQIEAAVVTHELAHLLGALPFPPPNPPPPHACADLAHTCDTERDILYGGSTDLPLESRELDPGHDDYYAHSGSWWDVQDSAWLTRFDEPEMLLSVAVDGVAPSSAAVVSDEPGIRCPTVCQIVFPQRDKVRLSAEPWVDGHYFAEWSGACTGDGMCEIAMQTATRVVAEYRLPTLELRVRVRGRGRVVSAPAGIVCPRDCRGSFLLSDSVRLRAVPARGWRVSRWGGRCVRSGTTCVLSPLELGQVAKVEETVGIKFARRA
ncbi:MAG TPA: hypothetical protein VF063_10475 [Gaiellaceae bacterium]